MANIMKAKEVGRHLKLSEATIYKLALKGELPGFKVGDSWRFDLDDVLKVVKDPKKRNEKKERNSNTAG